MPAPCKHAVVRIVSRHEEAEFVECLACGEIFDSVEYEDMAREEAFEAETAQDAQPAGPPQASRNQKPR